MPSGATTDRSCWEFRGHNTKFDAKGEEGEANLFYASYNYDEPINRGKASLDIFWLRDESLEDSDNLADPDVLALEIVYDLEAALEQFREIANDLSGKQE